MEHILKNARLQRELGFYNESNELFDKAICEQPGNIALALEAASVKMSQGLLGECQTALTALDAHIDRDSPHSNPLHLAMLDAFCALATAASTLRVKDPLDRACGAYQRHGLNKPVEAFDESTVTITSAYHNLLALSQAMGYQHPVALPSFSAEFQSSLARYLLSAQRHEDAIKIACLSGFDQDSYDNSPILEALLEEDKLTALQRARVLWEYGDRLKLTRGGDGWQQHLHSAARLYSDAGHETGALDVKVDLIRHVREGRVTADDTTELWRIKDAMEAVGNWSSATRALFAIIEINTQGADPPPEFLQAKVEEEWMRVTDRCGAGLERVSHSMSKLLEWQTTKARSAQGLEYLEHYYDMVKDTDAHFLTAFILNSLFTVYTKIGETSKAKECLDRRPDVLTSGFVALHGHDPFLATLEASTGCADTESELHALREELDRVRAVIRGTPGLMGRAEEVERLSNIAHSYLQQLSFRGHDQLKELLDCLLPVIVEECNTLDTDQSILWRGQASQHQGHLVEMRAESIKPTDIMGETNEELWASYLKFQKKHQDLIEEATCRYQDVVDLYDALPPRFHVHISGASLKLANSRRRLWELKRKLADSEDFLGAARLYEKGFVHGSLDARQTSCLSLLRLWFDGYKAKVHVDETIFHIGSAYEQAAMWAKEADRLGSIERNDISALPRERAVLAKQRLSKRKTTQELYSLAFNLHDTVDDDLGAWNWVQRSKARSISDMLALGINIPLELRTRIESDSDLTALLEMEESLVHARKHASPERLFLLQKQLNSHREEMKKRPVLKQVLNTREGQSTSLEKLQSISVATPEAPERKIFFVDWIIFQGQCCGIIASAAGISLFIPGVAEAEVQEWKSLYLVGELCDDHPLNKSEAMILPSKLVQPLQSRTGEGDIIVFCPSGGLHGVPLHAADIEDGSPKPVPLLERNPVIYTDSMTTFEQCISKELDRARSDRAMSRSYVSVYEETESGGALSADQIEDRNELYAQLRDIAAERQPASTALGPQVRAEDLMDAFQSDYAHFVGHCETRAEDMLKHALVLGLEGPEETPPIEQRLRDLALTSDGVELPSITSRVASHRFTASDIFNIDMQTSCLTLIACGSASQTHAQGDEPLGIVSAVLCAGGTSVIGTMWNADVKVATTFSEELDGYLAEGEESAGNVVDLAVAVQKTVLRLKGRLQSDSRYRCHWAAYVLHGSWFMSKRGRS